MSILDKTAENVDYSPNFRKMLIWVKVCKYFDIGTKFSKESILVKIVEKSQIWLNLSKNLGFGQNCLKFSIFIEL